MTTVFKTFNSYKQFVKYAFFGGIGVLTDIMIYSLLVYFNLIIKQQMQVAIHQEY